MVLAGIGPGSAGQMTLTVMEHMFHSRVLLGAPRMIESALKALDSLEQLFIHRIKTKALDVRTDHGQKQSTSRKQ